MGRVAIGIKPHTGWAVVVAVGGGEVGVRRRIELVTDDELRFAWHSSQLRERTPAQARAYERKVAGVARKAADRELRAFVAEAGEVVAAGIVGEPRELPDAAAILARHTLLHSAEGELYRSVLAGAAEALGLDVVHVHPKTATLDASFPNPGRPWTADHRAATAAALAALR